MNDILTIDLASSPALAALDSLTFNAGDGEIGDELVIIGSENPASSLTVKLGDAGSSVTFTDLDDALNPTNGIGTFAEDAQPIDFHLTQSLSLTQQALDDLVGAAEQRWIDSGLTAEQEAALSEISYQIADLEGTHLAIAEGSTITVDVNAAGNLWFVDATPHQDEEFTALSETLLGAKTDTLAYSKMDLLTVLLHEQGHVLGIEDVDSGTGNVMRGTLGYGFRVLPEGGQAEGAVPGLVDEEGCLWDNVPLVNANASADEVETEIRAQLDRALTMGFVPTHLDSHMATLFSNVGYFQRYMKVGIEHQIPIMMVGGHATYVRQENPEAVGLIELMAKVVWQGGLPLLDDLHTASSGWRDKDQKLQNFIYSGGRLVFYESLHHCRIEISPPGHLVNAESKVSEVLRLADFQVAHVGAVKYDALGVALHPAYPQGGMEFEIASGHRRSSFNVTYLWG